MTAALLHDTLTATAQRQPEGIALVANDTGASVTWAGFDAEVSRVARGLAGLGISRQARVGVYLPKTLVTATAFYAANRAGAAFVPINPLLRPAQVKHILRDCDVEVLVTSAQRAGQLAGIIADCPALHTLVCIDGPLPTPTGPRVLDWAALPASDSTALPTVIDHDMAAILYTSGSTGRPKGVIFTHRNLVAGALSVSEYLRITSADRLLAALPFSFDYGLNQLTTAVLQGASCVLMDYLLPRDVLRAVASHGITGLAAVPPLWNQLAGLDWPEAASASLRYFTNSGGALPAATLARLRERLPNAAPVLMYGLTEAFRSTWLPPAEIDRRPGSIGKAIPNAEILVINEHGARCGPGEAGELVHRGALVTRGYWNDPERTAERYRPLPDALPGIPCTELAVWSGDRVRMDEDGYLYFLGRSDGMIKTSGYRVSPEEVEEPLYASGLVDGVVAVGLPHPQLGQAIGLVAVPGGDAPEDIDTALRELCRAELPSWMQPWQISIRDHLPHTPNGKIDRALLARELTASMAPGPDQGAEA